MLINKNTKIGKLLKHHPGALEKIIAINPLFEKLRNPVLRKLMAGRTSIAMAARVGGCSPETFFRALKPLGFVSEHIAEVEPANAAKNPAFAIDPAKVVTMDVRPILAGGEDPLHQIQARVKELRLGEILSIINTFEPSPLIALLGKQGFLTHVNKVGDKHIETFFIKKQ
ncbi:MAG: DUF1858 domain-containing protein [Cyclobacteriaceae bacterium]|nr:DUF1858 domain-containing protein [Cyclobacteriaceae bacterium]